MVAYYPTRVKIVVSHRDTESRSHGEISREAYLLRATEPPCEKKIAPNPTKLSLAG